ncbi:MAG TPA: hypothetical protein PLK99_03245 [Burkholderiales bacterium]|nr:hypothetical protein [Burkholderiales bacterium]
MGTANREEAMRERVFLVFELINNPLPDPLVIEELECYGHACDKALALVTKSHVFSVLKKMECGELSPDNVTMWARRLEGRADLTFEFGEEGAVREAVFWLANPEINWPVDPCLGTSIEALFERRKFPRD